MVALQAGQRARDLSGELGPAQKIVGARSDGLIGVKTRLRSRTRRAFRGCSVGGLVDLLVTSSRYRLAQDFVVRPRCAEARTQMRGPRGLAGASHCHLRLRCLGQRLSCCEGTGSLSSRWACRTPQCYGFNRTSTTGSGRRVRHRSRDPMSGRDLLHGAWSPTLHPHEAATSEIRLDRGPIRLNEDDRGPRNGRASRVTVASHHPIRVAVP